MPYEEPGSPAELAEALATGRTVRVGGNFTKDKMAGPLVNADVTVTTRRMDRVLMYEPADLTVSVEAGITYAELSRILAEHRQMIPLDPPWADTATIGGILSANTNGPRRRLYGTARDMVIGMTFATLEGKLVQTGGMVVKNVAGLDMGKLMIGSFGTLAVIAVANFRVHPMPAHTRTFVWTFAKAGEAIVARDAVLKSLLQPSAIDLIKDEGEYRLMVQAGGNSAVLDRYSRELGGSRAVEGDKEAELWKHIREFTPRFLEAHENGIVVRIACKLTEVGGVLESLPDPAIARAGSGVVYGHFEDGSQRQGAAGVIDFAPQTLREAQELWPNPGDALETMKRIKAMLDPLGLLNRGRLYGRI
ncbi:MAG: FAD-binding oxidoreductase [Acidobacteriota bacterium]|nr:FAD-binding oxidoreductase [Acidobacteriota bacterium]